MSKTSEEPKELTADEKLEEALHRIQELEKALENKPLGEAPFILWGHVYNKQGEQYSFTARHHDYQACIDGFARGLRYLANKYELATSRPINEAYAAHLENDSVPLQETAAQTVATSQGIVLGGPKAAPVQTPQVAVTSAVPADIDGFYPGQEIKEQVWKIGWTPLADGKLKMEFYGSLRSGKPAQRPTYYEPRFDAKQWSEIMAPWGLQFEHLLTANTAQITNPGMLLVKEVASRKKNTGRYYHNYKELRTT